MKTIRQLPSYFWFFLVLLSVLACTPKMNININAIADQEASSPGKNYMFISGMDDVNEEDLFFKEFTRYFEYAMQENGFTRVYDRAQSDMLIRVKYAVSDGRSAFQVYQFPIYEHVGGQTITVSGTTKDSSGEPVSYQQTIHIPSRIQRIGTSSETRTYTLYNRTASLQAISAAKGEQSTGIKEEKAGQKVLWQIFLHSVAESTDLRQITPYFASAAIPFIGKNSGQQREIDIELNDPAVTELIRKVSKIPVK